MTVTRVFRSRAFWAWMFPRLKAFFTAVQIGDVDLAPSVARAPKPKKPPSTAMGAGVACTQEYTLWKGIRIAPRFTGAASVQLGELVRDWQLPSAHHPAPQKTAEGQ